jgi:hypothetical protein
MSDADRTAKSVALHSQVPWLECADPARRARLEADPVKWLRHYLAHTYTRPFERPHLAIIDGAIHASETGGRFAVAAERGVGKSSLLWGVVLYLKLTGHQTFPVCVPWSDKALKRAFRFWKSALCFNDAIGADYPEVCGPFRHSKGVAQRVLSTTWKGGPNDGKPTGAGLAVGEGLIVLPDNRGCIGGATVNGNPRGLNHPLPDGRVLRPTLAMLDDVQDRGTARSAQQVQDTIEIIDGDVAGMGEAGTNLPMLMSGNCIAPGDVMAHYLESDRWKSVRVSCVESWPEGWKDGDGPTAKLWEEWHDLYRAGKGSVTFYRKHKAEMTRGFRLSAPGTFKRSKGMPDAFCGVMVSWFKMGPEAFHAEKQQRPMKRGVTMYQLTPQIVMSRSTERPAGEVPEWAQTVVAATDVNRSYALSTVVVAFGAHQVAAVCWYGLHPMAVQESMTEIEKRRLIYEGLAVHGRTLAGLQCRPAYWVIDGGGSPEGTVIQFAFNAPQICGLQAACTFGRGWKNYRPVTKTTYRVRQGEQLQHVAERRDRQWIIYHADYWREVAQKAWLAAPGSPGSCSLPKGRHEDFAMQATREQLAGKEDVGGRAVWVWETAPGPHDFGDCMHMAYMAASVQGIGTGGAHTVQRRYVETRKCKVERVW